MSSGQLKINGPPANNCNLFHKLVTWVKDFNPGTSVIHRIHLNMEAFNCA